MLHVVTTGAYYYMKDFDYRSILFDNGGIVQCGTGFVRTSVCNTYYVCTTELQSKLQQKFTAESYIHPAVITFIALNT